MTGEESIVTMPGANSTGSENRGSHLSTKQTVSPSAAAAAVSPNQRNPAPDPALRRAEKELYAAAPIN